MRRTYPQTPRRHAHLKEPVAMNIMRATGYTDRIVSVRHPITQPLQLSTPLHLHRPRPLQHRHIRIKEPSRLFLQSPPLRKFPLALRRQLAHELVLGHFIQIPPFFRRVALHFRWVDPVRYAQSIRRMRQGMWRDGGVESQAGACGCGAGEEAGEDG